MVNLNKMYDGVINSPETYLTQNLAADATIIYVADSSVFGSLPNLAVIGTDQNAETILIKSKRSDGGLEVQRAIEGPAKRWEKTTAIARNFTNFDYQQIKENIEKLNKGKQESLTAGNNIQITNGRISATDTKYDDTKIKEDISELEKSQLAKASQTEAESGVDNAKYMTPQATKQAIEKLSPVKNSLSEMDEDSTHRTVTDEEKNKWNKKIGKNDIVNNLTDGGIEKALSAEQGKVLFENIKNNKGSLKEVVVPIVSDTKNKNGQEVTFWTDGKMVFYFIQLNIVNSDSNVRGFHATIPVGFRGKKLKIIPQIIMPVQCYGTTLTSSVAVVFNEFSIYVKETNNKPREVHYFGFYPLDTEVGN